MGTINNGSDVGIVGRYNTDGTPDTSFGWLGVTTVGTNIYPLAVAIDFSGRIVVVSTNISQAVVTRFTSSGALDTSFNGSGSIVLGLLSPARSVAIGADNRIVVAGQAGNHTMLIQRINTSGTVDLSVIRSFEPGVSGTDEAQALAVGSTGSIYVAGKSPSGSMAALRLTSSGAYDNTFGTGGHTVVNWGLGSRAWAMALDTQNKLVLVGKYTTGQPSILLVRLSTSGVVDANCGGTAFTPPITEWDSNRPTMVVSTGNNYYVGGTGISGGHAKMMVTRFNSTACTADNTFGSGGTAWFGISGAADSYVQGIMRDSLNRVVVVGFGL